MNLIILGLLLAWGGFIILAHAHYRRNIHNLSRHPGAGVPERREKS